MICLFDYLILNRSKLIKTHNQIINKMSEQGNKTKNQDEIVEYKISYEKRKMHSNSHDTYVIDTHIVFFHETSHNEFKKISLVIDGKYTDDDYDNHHRKFFSLRINDEVIVEDAEDSLIDFVQDLYECDFFYSNSKEIILIDAIFFQKLMNIANDVHIYPVTQFIVASKKQNSISDEYKNKNKN
jgi:hypothetical protein